MRSILEVKGQGHIRQSSSQYMNMISWTIGAILIKFSENYRLVACIDVKLWRSKVTGKCQLWWWMHKHPCWGVNIYLLVEFKVKKLSNKLYINMWFYVGLLHCELKLSQFHFSATTPSNTIQFQSFCYYYEQNKLAYTAYTRHSHILFQALWQPLTHTAAHPWLDWQSE